MILFATKIIYLKDFFEYQQITMKALIMLQ